MMPKTVATILIVDDDHTLRLTLSAVLAESGYRIRSAEDGLSALVELRREIPDIILSDLDMPRMCGFEFLSVVRRRFPAVHAIAMSGAYSGSEIPAGVAAEAFYAKGTSLAGLLLILGGLSRVKRPLHPHGASAPIWVATMGDDPAGKPYVVITCPECLRTFAQVVEEAVCSVHESSCAHCLSLVPYAVVRSTDGNAKHLNGSGQRV